MSSTFSVFPAKGTGNQRRIELAGIDLWPYAHIDNVFVYPSKIDVDQFHDALSRTLSLWPLVAGRAQVDDEDRYFIEMSDGALPVTLCHNEDLAEWSMGTDVVVGMDNTLIHTFVDSVRPAKIFDTTEHEPLVRFKLTHIVQSGEWVLGASWSHLLGDAAACLHFLTTLSHLYQQKEAPKPAPIFERRLWRKDEADPSLLPIMKQLRDAKPASDTMSKFTVEQSTSEQVNLQFSGAQLARLRALAGGNDVTIQDSLTAYVVLTLNTWCYNAEHRPRFLRTNNAVNCRGVSDDIAPLGHVSNAVFMMLSDEFDDPYSLSSIAAVVRRSIVQSRDAKFLETWLATADGLMRDNLKQDKHLDMGLFPGEIVVNSNFRFDWAGGVDFGFTDRCRFYTAWSSTLYLRVFRLNPKKQGADWVPRDRDGAEVAFRVEKGVKDTLLSAVQRDISENFENVKK